MIDTIAARFLGRLPSAVLYHWRWFISNYAYARGEGLLLERFQHAHNHPLFKSIVRLADVFSMRAVHFPEVVGGGYFVDSALDVVPASLLPHKAGVWKHSGSGYRGGQINHYWCKSFEEFLVKKRRGDQLAGPAADQYKRDVELFFAWNGEATPEDSVPTPPRLLERVHAQLRQLRAIPGMEALEARVNDGFRRLIDSAAGAQGAAELYNGLARKLSPAGTA